MPWDNTTRGNLFRIGANLLVDDAELSSSFPSVLGKDPVVVSFTS